MNMVTLASAHNSSLSQTFPSNANAPFSPYLKNSSKETFIRNLEKHQLGREKELEDDEIGVFRAEKYFSGVIDDETSSRASSTISSVRSCHYKNEEQRLALEQIKAKIQPRTPSVRSESSWNSRSVLLQSSTGGLINSSKAKTSKMNGKKFLANLGCKCYCSDENSVDTKEVGEISFNKSGSSNTNQFHRKTSMVSPVRSGLDLVEAINQINRTPKQDKLGSGSGVMMSRSENFSSFANAKTPFESQRNLPFQGPVTEISLCKSPEVFGGSSSSPALEKGSKSFRLERRLTTLSWDHAGPHRAAEDIVYSSANFGAGAGGAHHRHDSGSDASSDLFEIDSVTGKTNPFRARRPSDDAASGCVTPTTGYAPSEASIQWSVVTASQTDFSVMSDCEETTTVKPPTTAKLVSSAKARIMDKEMTQQQRRRSSTTLLGCKSHKAVNVAGDVYRASPKTSFDAGHVRFRSDSPSRFQAEITKLTDFNSTATHSPIIPRLHSPRNSHLLYIQ